MKVFALIAIALLVTGCPKQKSQFEAECEAKGGQVKDLGEIVGAPMQTEDGEPILACVVIR